MRKVKQASYLIQKVDELLQLCTVQVIHATLVFGAVVELAEGDLEFRRKFGELIKAPE